MAIDRPPRRGLAPALLAGTSSEYLGRRPLPRILRERPVVLLLGPPGAGKTRVALRLADYYAGGARNGVGLVYLNTSALQDALVEQVSRKGWAPGLLDARALVLDGPVWLRGRPAVVRALVDLLHARAQHGRRTLVCQADADCSIGVLMEAMEPGSLVNVALRFPIGSRGRLRFARRVCDELGLPRTAARGTEVLEPWGYDRVIAHLKSWRG